MGKPKGSCSSQRKIERIAHNPAQLQGKHKSERELDVQDMLMAYKDTPHQATGVTPYEVMLNRSIRTPFNHETIGKTKQRAKDKMIEERDKQYRERMTRQRRNVKEHTYLCIKKLCTAQAEED